MSWRSLIILFFLLAGCNEFGGTDTGNPNNEDGDHSGGNSRPIMGLFIDSLVELSCQKLEGCFEGVSYESCEQQVLRLEDVDTEIGLVEGEYSNLAQASYAEQDGEIQPAWVPAGSCLITINNMACDDPKFLEAFDPSLPVGARHSGFRNMLPEVCADVFLYSE